MTAPYQSRVRPGGDGFAALLRSEWTKFRSVRGWGVGMLVAVAVTVLVGMLGPAGSSSECVNTSGQVCSASAARTPPTGPGGEAVSDTFSFVHQPLAGDGSITAQVTSLTGQYSPDGEEMRSGVQPWSKAGVILKESTGQGSAYAAAMVTGGNGVRMQHNYVHDTAGQPGTSPRWLRLTRSGDTVTGYESADGADWRVISAVTLTGLPRTVLVGLFTTSPEYTVSTPSFGGTNTHTGPTEAIATFDNVTGPGTAWTGETIGERWNTSGYQEAGGTFTVRGTGDIAPLVVGQGGATTIENRLVGAFAGLIAVIVVAALFITAEYRRGLIRTTLAASPRRGRVLAAKAVVIGTVTFVTGLTAAVAAVFLVGIVERAKGLLAFPVSPLTELRVLAGTAALLAVAAVLAVAVGTVLRRSAGAVAAVIVAIVLPYILAVASVLPAGVADWLLRVTPAAGFAIQQSTPEYPQVVASYTPNSGYFPLPPWAGFAVLCAYAALAMAVAAVVLRRRDA